MGNSVVVRELRVAFTASVSDLKDKLNNIKSDMKSFTPAAKAMQAEYQKSFRVMSSVSDSLKKQVGAVTAELKRTGSLSGPAMNKLKANITDAADASRTMDGVLEELARQMQELGQTRIATDEYRQLKEELEAASRALDGYEVRQARMKASGVSETSVAWKNLQFNIGKTTQDFNAILDTMRRMADNGTAFTLGVDTSQYRVLEILSRDVAAAQRDLRQQIKLAGRVAQGQRSPVISMSAAYQQAEKRLMSAQTVTGRLKSAFQSAGSAMKRGLVSACAAVSHPVQTVNALLYKVGSAAVNGGKKAVSALGNGLKKAASAGASALTGLISRFRGVRSGAASVNTGLNSMVKSIRNIGVVSLGLRVCSGLFGQLRSVISNCVSSNEEMNSQVERLKNGLSSALAPAISVVINLLSKVLPYLIGIADAVASLITNIFGKGWTSVSTGASAAADSMDDVADATNGAADAQEAYNKTIAGFDEITKLDDSSSTASTGSSAGSGSGSTSATAEDTTGIAGMLPTWLTNLTTQIKDLFSQQDFSGIGELLAGKFGDLVDYLDTALSSGTFQEKLNKALNGVTDGINGFLSGMTFSDEGKQSVAARFGDLVGDGISLGLNSIHTVLSGIDWTALGTGLAQFVNGGLASLKENPVNFGTILADKINAEIHALGGLFSELDWGLIGSYAVDNVNSHFRDIDWSGAARTISNGIVGALESTSTFLEEFNWAGIASDVKIFLANVDWSGIASGIFESIGAALGGIGAFIWEFIRDGIANIGDYFDDSIDEAGGNVALGILNGIANVFVNIGEWVKTNIFQPFIDGFKKAFGIASPAKDAELLDAAGYVGEGILNGIAAVFTNMKAWVKEHILGPIKQGWENLSDKVLEIEAGIKTKASELWSNMKTGWNNLSNKVLEFTSSISTAASDIRDNLKTRWNNLSSKVLEFTSSISTAASNIRDDLKTRWNNLSSKVLSFTSSISTPAANIRDDLKTRWNNLSSKVLSFTSSISTAASNIRDDLKTRWNNLSSKTLSFAASISTSVSKLWSNFASGWRNKSLSLKVTYSTNVSSVKRAVYKALGLSGWPSIKFAARGGIVDGATLFGNTIVGEAGKEAIIPLESHTEWLDMVAQRLAAKLRAVQQGLMEQVASEWQTAIPVSDLSGAGWNGPLLSDGAADWMGQRIAESIVSGLAGRQEQTSGQLVVNVNVGGETLVNKVIRGVNQITRANGGVCPIET